MVSGASGLGSQRSIWLGAPQLKMRMTERALARPAGEAASARSQLFQKRDRAPIPLAERNCRRDRASVNGCIDAPRNRFLGASFIVAEFARIPMRRLHVGILANSATNDRLLFLVF